MKRLYGRHTLVLASNQIAIETPSTTVGVLKKCIFGYLTSCNDITEKVNILLEKNFIGFERLQSTLVKKSTGLNIF